MNILIPDSWLREYLETNATPDEIKDCLSLCGPSVESVERSSDDFIYNIEITSNRIDCVSVYGIAREAAAILPRFGFMAKLKEINFFKPTLPDFTLPLEILDPNKLCDRLIGIVMDGVSIGNSKPFIMDRLEKSGIRSLNNVIDITNYLMLELGHPCHVFDYDRIKTGKLILRRAKDGEKLVTFDGKECTLDEQDIIIDDGTGRIIDLPGIIGAQNSVVVPETKRIVFFIESNNPVAIRKTSLKLGIRTLAATINEKHPDPELTKLVIYKGVELYQKFANAKVTGQIINIYPNPPKHKTIVTSSRFINSRLGIELKNEEIVSILTSLQFTVKMDRDKLAVVPPTCRTFDISIPEDVVEEVTRIYGYHKLPSVLMTGSIPIPKKPKDLPIGNKIKTMLKYWGYTETQNYSFISKALIEKARLKTSNHLKLSNPLTTEFEYMRISLIPSMLQTIANNQAYSDNLQIFELAKIYLPKNNDLPTEKSMLVISNQSDFYILKGIIEKLFDEFGIREYKSAKNISHFFHPLQSVNYEKQGKQLAICGAIHPEVKSSFCINNQTFLAELDINFIVEMADFIKKYTPIPPFPPMIENLTIVINPNDQIGPVIEEVSKTSKLVKKTELIDRYQNSITLRITYQRQEKNLTSEEIKTVRQKILENLGEKFGVTLKSS